MDAIGGDDDEVALRNGFWKGALVGRWVAELNLEAKMLESGPFEVFAIPLL